MAEPIDVAAHGAKIERINLKGGRYDGVVITAPHSVVTLKLDDEPYFRTHRRSDGDAQFVHLSIWGRA